MVLTRVLPLILMAGVAIPGLSQSRIVQRVEERIAGGRPATYREFPFQVAILDHKMKQICGGSLISPLEVLTAAHCLDDEKVSNLTVIAGSLTSRWPYSATHQARKIAKKFVHRHYHKEGYDYDIAILRLNCSFDIQASDGCIKTIDLPKEHYTVRGFVIICGYGAKKPDGSSRNTLYTTVMKVLPDEKC
uniref:Putative serine protease n=1 Tax=Ixodes ricinus TaxID=34613 RepID=A0A6B0V0Y0_IXORI